MKKELGIPSNVRLTPHTLRRAFATFNAEAGLPLPLLSKMLGHSSVRTTALYWVNTHHGEDDDDNDISSILVGRNWLEEHEPEMIKIPHYWERAEQLAGNLWTEQQTSQDLQQQLAEKDEKTAQLQRELTQAEEQNANLWQELATAKQTITDLQEQLKSKRSQTDIDRINGLEQELANEKEKRIIAANNLSQEKQVIDNLYQQLQAEQEHNRTLQETNANLTQKLNNQEQTIINLQNAYQITLKDKEAAEILAQTEKQRVDNCEQQLKTIGKILHQWQKINYYQQLEKPQLKAQIVQREPPPFK